MLGWDRLRCAVSPAGDSVTMLTIAISPTRTTRVVHIPAYGASLVAELTRDCEPRGLVIFAEDGCRPSMRSADHETAAALHRSGYATLWLDLLTPDEELLETVTTPM